MDFVLAKKIIRIATRQSPLALWQAQHVAKLLQQTFPEIQTELVKMVTQGDKILDAPLAKIGGKGLFVKELEQGLLNHQADIAVHSMKDVPVELPTGLHLAIILEREDPRDALVSNKYHNLADLPENPRIGTCSLRRQCQIMAKFPHAEILPLRGNVNTRLAKLDADNYDAIILATAGLNRLNMAHRIKQKLTPELSLPAIGQGAIGIESRIDDHELNQKLQALHHPATAIRITAERAMNQRLEGGCQVPIAGFAQLDGDNIWLRGLVGSIDGKIIYRAETRGHISQAHAIGIQVAESLLDQGANDILQNLAVI